MNCLHVDGSFSKRIYDLDYELAYSLAYLNECIETYENHTAFLFLLNLYLVLI